eukprot:6181037-Pleurochrysis_carterae.AAC.1
MELALLVVVQPSSGATITPRHGRFDWPKFRLAPCCTHHPYLVQSVLLCIYNRQYSTLESQVLRPSEVAYNETAPTSTICAWEANCAPCQMLRCQKLARRDNNLPCGIDGFEEAETSHRDERGHLPMRERKCACACASACVVLAHAHSYFPPDTKARA